MVMGASLRLCLLFSESVKFRCQECRIYKVNCKVKEAFHLHGVMLIYYLLQKCIMVVVHSNLSLFEFYIIMRLI